MLISSDQRGNILFMNQELDDVKSTFKEQKQNLKIIIYINRN